MAENLDKIKEVEENDQKSGQDQGSCTSDKRENGDVAAQHDINETRPISGVAQAVQVEDEVSLENIPNQIQFFKNQLGPHDKASVGLSEKPKQKNRMVLFIGQTQRSLMLWRSIASLKTAERSTQKGKREQKENYGISKLPRLVVREKVFNRGVSSNERDMA